MRKWLLLLLVLGLCGCSAADYETISDEYVPLPQGEKAGMVLSFSAEEEAGAMELGEEESLYFCEGYTLTKQTLAAGDLDATLREVTGYGRRELNVMAQNQGAYRRYDFVWICAGEGGDQVCRGSILDDGNYHYVVTTMASEADAGDLADDWNALFSSFTLNTDPQPSDTEP